MRTHTTPAVTWPPGGASSTTSTASPGRTPTDFGALLDQHQARTAVAEGPKKHKSLEKPEAHGPAQPAAPRAHERAGERGPEDRVAVESKPADKPVEAKPQTDGAGAQTGTEQEQPQLEGGQPQQQPTVETPAVVVDPLAELTQPVLSEAPAPAPTPAPVTVPPADQPAAETPAQQPVVAEQVAVTAEVALAAAPVAAPVVAAAPLTPAPAAEAAPVAAAPGTEPQPASQPEQQTAAPVVSDGVAAEAAPQDAPEAPVTRADKPAQPQGQTAGQPSQQQGADQRSGDGARAQTQAQGQQPGQAPPADAPRVAGNRPVQPQHQQQPQPQQAQPAAPVTAPAAATAPQAPNAAATTAPVRAVPLSQAADAVENVIRLGSARGVTHARMSLKPAELGGVEIRLQQTSTGLVASVVADGAEAAQVLQQAGQELRRQLEAQGIELRSLDISYSGDERDAGRSSETRTGDGERRSAAGESSTATDGGDLNPTDEATATSTLELPDGVLVDVLA